MPSDANGADRSAKSVYRDQSLRHHFRLPVIRPIAMNRHR